MTFLVLESCIRCKLMDCIEVCPVDCFHEGPNMLVIDPDECIDCTLCEPECPVDAIVSEDEIPEGQEKFLAMNEELSQSWPVITELELRRKTPTSGWRSRINSSIWSVNSVFKKGPACYFPISENSRPAPFLSRKKSAFGQNLRELIRRHIAGHKFTRVEQDCRRSTNSEILTHAVVLRHRGIFTFSFWDRRAGFGLR